MASQRWSIVAAHFLLLCINLFANGTKTVDANTTKLIKDGLSIIYLDTFVDNPISADGYGDLLDSILTAMEIRNGRAEALFSPDIYELLYLIDVQFVRRVLFSQLDETASTSILYMDCFDRIQQIFSALSTFSTMVSQSLESRLPYIDLLMRIAEQYFVSGVDMPELLHLHILERYRHCLAIDYQTVLDLKEHGIDVTLGNGTEEFTHKAYEIFYGKTAQICLDHGETHLPLETWIGIATELFKPKNRPFLTRDVFWSVLSCYLRISPEDHASKHKTLKDFVAIIPLTSRSLYECSENVQAKLQMTMPGFIEDITNNRTMEHLNILRSALVLLFDKLSDFITAIDAEMKGDLNGPLARFVHRLRKDFHRQVVACLDDLFIDYIALTRAGNAISQRIWHQLLVHLNGVVNQYNGLNRNRKYRRNDEILFRIQRLRRLLRDHLHEYPNVLNFNHFPIEKYEILLNIQVELLTFAVTGPIYRSALMAENMRPTPYMNISAYRHTQPHLILPAARPKFQLELMNFENRDLTMHVTEPKNDGFIDHVVMKLRIDYEGGFRAITLTGHVDQAVEQFKRLGYSSLHDITNAGD